METLAQNIRSLGDFASIISHDLKAPLQVISGFCELLQLNLDYKDNAENIGYLNRIVNQVLKMFGHKLVPISLKELDDNETS